MSTKIYNAYRFIGKAPELLNKLFEYKQRWYDFQLNRLVSVCLDDESMLYDIHLLKERIIEQSNKRFPTVLDTFDVRGSFVIYFHANKIYFQTFLQSTIIFSGIKPPEFKDLIRCKDYHYQNQTDPWYEDHKLSEKQLKRAIADWEERKKVWDSIFMRTDIPSSAGLVYELIDTTNILELAFNVSTKVKSIMGPNRSIT